MDPMASASAMNGFMPWCVDRPMNGTFTTPTYFHQKKDDYFRNSCLYVK
jgi:hypothetical protein